MFMTQLLRRRGEELQRNQPVLVLKHQGLTSKDIVSMLAIRKSIRSLALPLWVVLQIMETN